MFKKTTLFLITCFFLLTITTSIIKNKARNIEKDIEKIKRDISLLEEEISDAEIDFTYLSNPEQLTRLISGLNIDEYTNFESSRIYFSTEHFLRYNSKQSKNLLIKIPKW